MDWLRKGNENKINQWLKLPFIPPGLYIPQYGDKSFSASYYTVVY